MEGTAIFHALSTVAEDKPHRAAQSAVGLRSHCPSAQNECVLQAYYAFAKRARAHTKINKKQLFLQENNQSWVQTLFIKYMPSEGPFKSSAQGLFLTEMESVKTMGAFLLTWLMWMKTSLSQLYSF